MNNLFFKNFFLPTGNIAYFSVYFDFWKEIIFDRKWENIATIKLLIFLTILMAFKYALIELLNPSTIFRIVLFDGFNLVLPDKKGLSALSAAGIIMTSVLLRLCYLKGERLSYLDLESVLFKNHARSLLWQTYKGQNACKYLIAIANKILKANIVVPWLVCKFLYNDFLIIF